MYVHQKSDKLFLYSHLFGTMNQRAKGRKSGWPSRAERLSCCPCAFPNLARFHDEATTSDHGGDTGNQFNIASGADEHGKKANNDQEACYKEGACRDSDRTPNPGAARADAEPAGPDRRPQTGER